MWTPTLYFKDAKVKIYFYYLLIKNIKIFLNNRKKMNIKLEVFIKIPIKKNIKSSDNNKNVNKDEINSPNISQDDKNINMIIKN